MVTVATMLRGILSSDPVTVLASGILLYRRAPDGPRLLLLRNRDAGHWGFAKGRRDAEDTHEVSCALREVGEETGYTGLSLHAGFRAELEYLVRNDGEPYPKRVVYFLAEAPGREPVLSEEHEDHRWADPREADELLNFGQLRDLAQSAFAALAGP